MSALSPPPALERPSMLVAPPHRYLDAMGPVQKPTPISRAKIPATLFGSVTEPAAQDSSVMSHDTPLRLPRGTAHAKTASDMSPAILSFAELMNRSVDDLGGGEIRLEPFGASKTSSASLAAPAIPKFQPSPPVPPVAFRSMAHAAGAGSGVAGAWYGPGAGGASPPRGSPLPLGPAGVTTTPQQGGGLLSLSVSAASPSPSPRSSPASSTRSYASSPMPPMSSPSRFYSSTMADILSLPTYGQRMDLADERCIVYHECPECGPVEGSGDIIIPEDTGCPTCTRCGIMLQKDFISDEPETFVRRENDGTEKTSTVSRNNGGAEAMNMETGELESTMIEGGSNNRLRKLHTLMDRQESLTPNRRRDLLKKKLSNAKNVFDDVVPKLRKGGQKLPDDCLPRCNGLAEKAYDAGATRKQTDTLHAACIVQACEESQIMVNRQVVALQLNITPDGLTKRLNLLRKEGVFTTPKVTKRSPLIASDIATGCAKLQLSAQVAKIASDAATQAEDQGLISINRKLSNHAAILVFMANILNVRTTSKPSPLGADLNVEIPRLVAVFAGAKKGGLQQSYKDLYAVGALIFDASLHGALTSLPQPS